MCIALSARSLGKVVCLSRCGSYHDKQNRNYYYYYISMKCFLVNTMHASRNKTLLKTHGHIHWCSRAWPPVLGVTKFVGGCHRKYCLGQACCSNYSVLRVTANAPLEDANFLEAYSHTAARHQLYSKTSCIMTKGKRKIEENPTACSSVGISTKKSSKWWSLEHAWNWL